MGTITISKSKVEKKKRVVVLPLDAYEAIQEELEMLRSKNLAKDIKKARIEIKSGRVVSFADTINRIGAVNCTDHIFTFRD